MNKLRTILLTAGTFSGIGLLLALPSVLPVTTAAADATVNVAQAVVETVSAPFTPSIDTSRLSKWRIDFDRTVSTDPIRESIVTKIAGGKLTEVHVVETASGIYSSDALGDPHVLYPGVHRTRVSDASLTLQVLDGNRWVTFSPLTAGSFVSLTPFEGGARLVTDGLACSLVGRTMRC